MKKILLATDGSESATDALRAAVELAEESAASIDVLTVARTAPAAKGIVPTMPSEDVEEARRIAEEHAKAVRDLGVEASGESSLDGAGPQPDVRNGRGERFWLGARNGVGPNPQRRRRTMATQTKKTTTRSPKAAALLVQLQRRDLDHTHVDESAYRELHAAGLATVIFSRSGNWVFATARGRAA